MGPENNIIIIYKETEEASMKYKVGIIKNWDCARLQKLNATFKKLTRKSHTYVLKG